MALLLRIPSLILTIVRSLIHVLWRKFQKSHRTAVTHPYVRLLALAPGRENDIINCSLIVSPLQSAPTYKAISYVWGDATKRIGIRCSGRSLIITTSLHVALKHLRLQDCGRMLWADAICINQDDLDETQLAGHGHERNIFSSSTRAYLARQ